LSSCIILTLFLHQEIIICLENSLFSLEMLEDSFKAIKAFSRQIKGFKTFKTMFFMSMISTENMVLKVLKSLICLGKITGYVTHADHRYGLPQVWAWVVTFPPARNPHLQVGVVRMGAGFFFSIAEFYSSTATANAAL
jgi:hypothetical protein